MATHRRLRLGDLLIESGAITPVMLEEALKEQKRTKERLGDILLRRGLIREDMLFDVLSSQMGIERIRGEDVHVEPELLQLIPESMAKKYRVLPTGRDGQKLIVAMVDPLDYYAMDDLELLTGYTIQPVLISREDYHLVLARLYRQGDTWEKEGALEDERDEIEIALVDSPVARYVQEILERAVRLKASDVHIDPQSTDAELRFRLDGKLHSEGTISKSLYRSVATRVKILAELDIAEYRKPQDGRFRMQVDGREIDVRVSVLPTIHGEKVVLRLLDRRGGLLSLGELEFSPEHMTRLKAIMQRTYGIILVTGPTGSGKTTTLYAMLKEKQDETVNIITIEDPVEYELAGINQVNVQVQSGLTFASGLRAILRQDPNIIMVGEIRDLETAEIAIRAALTGHLVLSTLHTNDALGAIDRLKDMGIPAYLIAAATNGVIAQRLVRRICMQCRTPYTPSEEERIILEAHGKSGVTELYHGRGCASCGMTGYRGRIAVHEVVLFDEAIRRKVAGGTESDALRQIAREKGYGTLWEDALKKVLEGKTTMQEVLAEVST
ncbi:MAG: Type IV fimbrial assembly, ATPase PilB [Candidatus Carbobacillus altaicus]|uniref:Type IV fimbrial assembly, ATPase PilB n=1 Tax=Candidatus Carbonibacillus altaicus TaxID=2163959 RepID=A0A2R6XYM4_9BACL|nr:MAG: Type IV fimbrial assembly, ATPase PilB [Candidatus Carbobacillus altaicus]